jgi:transposase
MKDSVVGIDVAKDKLDVFIDSTNLWFTVENTPAGIASIRDRLKALSVKSIVIEHSGGYERRCASDLLEAGFVVALINPRQARDFARAINWFAKNDRIDARLLAEFGHCVDLRPSEKISAIRAELDELVSRRRQLVQMRSTEQTRLLQAEFRGVKESINRIVRQLDRQIEKLEQRIAKLIDSNDDWRGMVQLLQSVPGVGSIVANTLVAELPELGKINRQEVASLVGLAPFDRESGRWKGKRHCYGGRASVRSVLYMATLSARRCNPIIRCLADRLKSAGKAYKVVMVACMRKLLTILNVIAASGKPWHHQPTISS